LRREAADFLVFSTPALAREENEALKARIAALEAKLDGAPSA
jgi:BMFP domain-containing protein YqiC